jgi:hypothetical protein
MFQGSNFQRDLILSGSLFTAFMYLQLLLRDLDNPFEYDGKASSVGIIAEFKAILNLTILLFDRMSCQ